MDLITGEQHGSNEEIVIEPFSLNDIKCNTTDCEFQNSLPLETDGTQIKYFSAAMGVMGSKRKRESSISSSLSIHKQAHSNWRHALLKARSQSDPWEAFHLENYPTEKALRHRYNALKKDWFVDEVEVKMETEPFAHGAMRQCYRIKKLSNFSHNQDWRRDRNNAVAKCFINPPEERNTYFEEVKLQMDAKLWGEEFNRHNPPKKVDFFMMAVLEFVDRPNRPLYHIENFIEGNYVKYNSNSGFVLENDIQSFRRQTPQAFSHFTFERSGHEIMVVDIQGVGDLYTDPQIHTVSGHEYGDGNLGTRGMALFFHTHVCNSICTNLGLTPFDLAPSELVLLTNQPSPLTDVGTVSRGNEDICVLPSNYHRNHLTEFLRARSSSSIGSCSSLTEIIGEEITRDEDDDSVEQDDSHLTMRTRLASSGEKSISPPSPRDRSVHFESSDGVSVPLRRQRLVSESSGSITDEADRLAFRQSLIKKQRSSCVMAEMEARKLMWEKEDRELEKGENMGNLTGGSVLGQIHLDMAKYHEIQRFTKPDQEGYDKEAALFHLRHAADCGNLDAIITMARVALQLPHDVLTDLTMDESVGNTDIGLDYMHSAASAGDRAAMVYLGKAYDSGNGLGTRSISWTEAAHWYSRSVSSMEATDEEGNFDGTMDDPPYQLLGRLAEMYRDGGNEITVDPALAADYFTQAADSAMAAMKGRLANKYYALAEEMNALIEE